MHPPTKRKENNMTTNLTPNTFNEAWIASAWKKLTQEIAYKTYNMNLPLSAADIASRAITYALKPVMDGTGNFPTSEKHLMCTARKIAKWAIIDAVKKSSKMMESTDEMTEDDDGTDQELSQYEVTYVLQLYRENKIRSEAMAMGRSALSKLDTFLAMKGVSKRDIEIYKARDLYKEPTDVVCAKHSVTPENLYKIVSVTKSILRKCGRAIINA